MAAMTTTKLDVVVVVAVVVVVSCGGDRGAGGAGGDASVSGRNSCIGGVGIEDVQHRLLHKRSKR